MSATQALNEEHNMSKKGSRLKSVISVVCLCLSLAPLAGCFGGSSYYDDYSYDPRYDDPRFDPRYSRPVYRDYSPWGTRYPYSGPPSWYDDPTW